MSEDNRTLLIVEDDCLEAIRLREAFRGCGVTEPIEVVGSGDAALDFLQRHGEAPPALAVIDLETPGAGFDLLRHLRSSPDLGRVPAVMFSSREDEEALCAAQDLGADAFLVRPPASEDLQAAAARLADRWLWTQPS